MQIARQIEFLEQLNGIPVDKSYIKANYAFSKDGYSLDAIRRLSPMLKTEFDTPKSLNGLLNGKGKQAYDGEVKGGIGTFFSNVSLIKSYQFIVVADNNGTYSVLRIRAQKSPSYTFYLQVSGDSCKFVEARDIAPFQQQARKNWGEKNENDLPLPHLNKILKDGLRNNNRKFELLETTWFTVQHATEMLSFLRTYPQTAMKPYYSSLYSKIASQAVNIKFVRCWEGDFISFLYNEPGVFSENRIRGENAVKHVELFDRIWSEYKTNDKRVEPIYSDFEEAYDFYRSEQYHESQRMRNSTRSTSATTPAQRHSSSASIIFAFLCGFALVTSLTFLLLWLIP